MTTFDESKFSGERYLSHVFLKEVGGSGQNSLLQSKVLVVGAGGIGSTVIPHLAASGVGNIGIIDHDKVELSNLQRQPIYNVYDIGKSKVDEAGQKARLLNPGIKIDTFSEKLTGDNSESIFLRYDLIIDGSDNFQTRHIVNSMCVYLGKPLISGAIGRWDGYVATFNAKEKSPCYACVFSENLRIDEQDCSQQGVVGGLSGLIGSMVVIEVIKFITKTGNKTLGYMIAYDSLHMSYRVFDFVHNRSCSVCAKNNRI